MAACITQTVLSESPDGHFCAEVIVCGTNGKAYPNPCAFAEAQNKDPALKEASC